MATVPDTAADTAAATEPLISLITTVRDGARYLAQALESVLAQTFSRWELILWDDGSTDDTLPIMRAFAARDSRIRCFTHASIGRRAALVRAHAEARAPYLAWLDGDDWLAPDALAKAHAALVATGADMVYTDHHVVGTDGSDKGLGRRTRIPYSAHRLLLDFMTFHLRVLSRDIFERAGGIAPDREIAIDYDLCLRISEQGRIMHLAEPLYFYRQHDGQMSSRKHGEQIAASAAAIRAAIERRGLSTYALWVDEAKGKFRLLPRLSPRARPNLLRIAAATAFPSLRPASTPAQSIAYWPSGDSVRRHQLYAALHARGFHSTALGGSLARLVRAVWTGRVTDVLHVHDLSPLFAAREEGSRLASCVMFLKTLDHARARGARIVFLSSAPLSAYPTWFVRAFRDRAAFVTHCEADRDGATYVPHPDLADAYPQISREFARALLGLSTDAPTRLYLGSSPETPREGDLVLDGDVDAYPPRHVAAYFAAADLVVIPSVTATALALARSMGKPIVAPSDGDFTALDRADAARTEWSRLGTANLARARADRWDAIVDAMTRACR